MICGTKYERSGNPFINLPERGVDIQSEQTVNRTFALSMPMVVDLGSVFKHLD